MNKLEKIKFGFHNDKNGKIDIYNYGKYRIGLTIEEIQDYLRARTNNLNIKKVYRQFNILIQGSTVGSADNKILIYHHDVERFVDEILDGTPTYFD